MEICFNELNEWEKVFAYVKFIQYGCFDTYQGFCKYMNESIINPVSYNPIEI